MAKSLVAAANVDHLPAAQAAPGELVPTGLTSAPYVAFISAKSKTWATAVAAIPGLSETEPVLFRGTIDPPVKLSPFIAHLWTYKQFWGVMSDTGELIAATYEKPESFKSEYKEIIETLLLVHFDKAIIPARCTFKNATAPAVHTMCEAMKKASTPEWGKISPAHEQTLQVPNAAIRFTANIQSGKKISRATGRGYAVASARISPVTESQYKTVLDYFKDTKNRESFAAALASFNNRASEVEELVNG